MRQQGVKKFSYVFFVIDISLENNGNIVLTDKIKVYILELPKIERMKSEDKNLNLWIKFIKDLEVKEMAENEEKDEKLEETVLEEEHSCCHGDHHCDGKNHCQCHHEHE